MGILKKFATNLALFAVSACMPTTAQTTREYIHANGKVIAIEAPAIPLVVTPDPVSTILAPNGTLSFSANRAATWSVSPATAGTMSLLATTTGQATVFTAAGSFPAGVTQATVVATAQDGSGVKNVVVQLMTPITISGISTTLTTGGAASYSANIPVTWSVTPSSAATVSPTSTGTNVSTILTIASQPPGNPPSVTLRATDARALTDSRFAGNVGDWTATIQYAGGPPVPLGSWSSGYYDGPGIANYVVSFNDPVSAQNVQWMAIHFSPISGQTVANSCALYVYPIYSIAYLLTDDGSGVTVGDLGSDTILRNSQCLIDLKGIKITDTGVRRDLQVSFYTTPAFLGFRDLYIAAGNTQTSPWQKIGPNLSLYYSAQNLLTNIHPFNPGNVNQDFRTAAVLSTPGSSLYDTGIIAFPGDGSSCQLVVYPGIDPASSYAYLYNTGIYYDSSYMNNTAYTLTSPLCNVPVNTIRIDSYLQATPSAPFAFFKAQIQANANTALRGGIRAVYGSMLYFVNPYTYYSESFTLWSIRP